ncbi:uncharacterized protein SPSK_10542 [Sporothrix schenckii 1099-18]|uniref:Uncharacterized protein n=1 Tax=Sporothrix schenckii 1099-18 TaxID=1397361 RepID=A0A0F2LYX7_SPOSC|nr:uncharacterized protein SPSK_10542 [Sporothrix schenckii 1099-18]KJR82672.1 hypothetical protein SPSK_10542 [Sporothrix schenckii 1099-18]
MCPLLAPVWFKTAQRVPGSYLRERRGRRIHNGFAQKGKETPGPVFDKGAVSDSPCLSVLLLSLPPLDLSLLVPGDLVENVVQCHPKQAPNVSRFETNIGGNHFDHQMQGKEPPYPPAIYTQD